MWSVRMAIFAGTGWIGERFAKRSIETLLFLEPSHSSGKPTDPPLPLSDTLQKDAHRFIEMMNYELHMLSVSTTRVAEVLLALIITHDLMVRHEYKIGGMNPFQCLRDDMTFKPASDSALAVHLSVLIQRSTRQFKKEARDQ